MLVPEGPFQSMGKCGLAAALSNEITSLRKRQSRKHGVVMDVTPGKSNMRLGS
jgi:hypothetical protein